MEEKIRTVKYTLEGVNIFGYQKPNIFDYEDEDEKSQQIFKERIGVFHGIGKEIHLKDDNAYEISCAIIEDCDDHKLHNVPITNVQFIN